MSAAEAATQFVEEVKFEDLEFKKIVGRGSFGVVSQAKWKDKMVAVKMIETEAEIKAFLVEVRQLSRVNHPNIVKVYGACTQKPVCLVMEYADGGSLYNVLHGNPPIPQYTAAHAMSWALQCAKGVSYLHGMKPKALIHRDLKPANLLLVAGGTTLKICDFGTACDIQTYMTNNKGSAAWMAPEVFEGSNYSERCDVFSWGIILWEVMSRRKPFDEIGGPAFRIMWAVHNGTRPPMIKNLPKPLEFLMTRCWAKEPSQRPSMDEVCRVMTPLMQFFKGADEPLLYPVDKEEGEYENESNLIDWTSPISNLDDSTTESKASTLSDTVIRKQPTTQVSSAKYQTQPAPLPGNGVIRRDSGRGRNDPKRHSADLLEIMGQGQSQQASPAVQTHRRSNSHGNIPPQAYMNPTTTTSVAAVTTVTSTATLGDTARTNVTLAPNHIPHAVTYPELNHGSQSHSSTESLESSASSSSANVHLTHVMTAPGSLDQQQKFPINRPMRSMSWEPPGEVGDYIPMAYLTLDHHLQPLPPCQSSTESMKVFDMHCRAAHEYLRVQTELALLHQRKRELADELDQDWKEQQHSSKFLEEYTTLMEEKQTLVKIHKEMKAQLDLMRQQRRPGSLFRR
ncbi:mitogen-activated protein kinase kinase kinase 7-like [Glandiceps talaboti]